MARSPYRRRRRARTGSWTALLGAVLLAGACSATASTSTQTSGSGRPSDEGPSTTQRATGTTGGTTPTTTPTTATSTTPKTTTTTTTTTTTMARRHKRTGPALVPLPAPAALVPFSFPAQDQGKWHAAGRLVGGHAAVYETMLTPPGAGFAAGVAWMDPRLLRAQLYSGSLSPGRGPWKLTAPISPAAARTVVAAFNGGFKFPASEGGYYAEGRLAYPLRPGGASLVIYKNGDATVGSWGRDVGMTPAVVAVRQNLTLLVDGGKAVAGLNPYDTAVWGSALGGLPNVWRSGLGVTASGALVYVTGPSLDITQLAALLVRAGCIRAMTLDMNPDWTIFATYSPQGARQPAAPANGSALVPGTVQGPYTFFEAWWARDFITMSAR